MASNVKMPEEDRFASAQPPLKKGPRSIFALPIRKRLPLLIGALLFLTVSVSTWVSYRGAKQISLESGQQRLESLTHQFANLFQQSAIVLTSRTYTAANEPSVRAFLQSPSAETKLLASAALKQFITAQDSGSLHVELWRSEGTLALILPEGSTPEPVDLRSEFERCNGEPFRTAGSIRFVKDTIVYPLIAAVKDESGKPLGYLVRWRKLAANSDTRKQVTDLLEGRAVLYFGNIQGDLLSDLVKPVALPPTGLQATTHFTQYIREGNSVLALGQPINGTPWFIVVELPVAPLFVDANRFLRRMVLMIGIVFALGITGAILLTRNITRPLHSLTQAAGAIAGGDYARNVDIRRDDELGELARAFNQMAVKVRDAQRDLELKVQERTLQLEAAPCAMLMIDQEGLVTLVNAQAEQLFGYERSELLGRSIEMLVPERYRQGHPGHRRIFSGHPTTRAMGAGRNLFGLRKDGSEVPVEIGLNPIQTESGAFVLASIIDITERKQADERFRLVVEGAPSAMLMVNSEGRITLVNTQAERLFGYSRSELLDQPMEILIPARYRASHPGHRAGFFQTPSTRAMGAGRDLFGLRKDGSEVPIEIGLNPIRTDEGRFVLASIVDITERKQAELKLRRSQEQLAGIIASAMDAVITVDEEQRILLFNGAAERMFLFPAEDAIGQPLDRFIPERFRAAHAQHVRGFGSTHVTRRSMGALGALYGLRADGEEFPIEASISQIESDGEKLYTVILRDVSERKRSEEALKEQARILDLAPVLIRDLNGRILFWNKGAEQMYGWTPEEALEKFTQSLFKTEFPRPEEEIKARLLARGHWEGELVHTTRDGRRLVIDSHWVLHRDEHDKPRAILEVNNDITDRKQAEREIRRLNEELEQRVAERTAQLQAANKELEAFSYSVSHDLRAPLRHINGFSQALLEDYSDHLDESGRNYLSEVRSASQEMAKLIDDLLQLARLSRGEMRSEEVDLSELAHSVIEELKKINGQRNVTIEIKQGLKARGDKRLLRVMLTNLLGNAWKFTSQREQAEVGFGQARQNGESIYFVRDNGAGFDMTYANKLFGAFQRLHTAGEFEGTGIGLATVQRIITRHGGRVWAEGAVNEGATFYFTLPNSKETDGEQSDSAGGRQSER